MTAMVELYFLLFFSFTGWIFSHFLIVRSAPTLRLMLAPYLGVSVCVVCTLSVRMVAALHSLTLMQTSAISLAFLMIALLSAFLYLVHIKALNLVHFFLLVLAATFAHFLDAEIYTKFSIIMSGDSWKFIDPALTLKKSINYGYPIFLQHTQLITLIAGDDYFFPGINLFIGLGLAGQILALTFHHIRLFKIPFIWAACASLIAPALLFSSWNGFVHLSYFNHHIVAACSILTMVMALDKTLRLTNLNSYLCWTFAFIILCISRLEGAFVGYVLLSMFLFQKEKLCKQEIAIVLTTIFIGVIASLTIWNLLPESDANKYLVIIVAGPMLLAATLVRINFALEFKTNYSVASLSFLTIGVGCYCLIFNDELAKQNLIFFFRKIVDFEIWGNLGWYLLSSTMIVSFLGWKAGQRPQAQHYYRAFLLLFLFLLSLLMVRGWPNTPDWSDSSNRILFQFLPLLVIWVCTNVCLYAVLTIRKASATIQT